MIDVRNLPPAERAVVRKVALRLLPFLTLLYLVAFLDRVNIGFAALTMNQAIGLSNTAYGFGAGVFFIGYFLFEVPSNLALQRFGARRWIARIMISWGIVSMLMIFAQGPLSFYLLRFLLGVAEAGFFPGIILYLTYWFPNNVRSAAVGVLLLANPLASIVGAPVSTALLDTPLFGLAGWQTLLFVEGVPAVALGIVVLGVLRDQPGDAPWLTGDERRTLLAAINRDRSQSRHASLRAGLLSPEIWALAFVYFAMVLGIYGFGFFAPKIIEGLGKFSHAEIGWLAAVPYAVTAVAMILWSRHSDASGERAWHLLLPALSGAAGFMYCGFAGNVWIAMASLTLGAAGIYSIAAVFWSVPTALLTGSAAAGGIALINSIGNLSGFFGPSLVGYLKDRSGDYTGGLITLGASLAVSGLAGFRIARKARERQLPGAARRRRIA